LKIGTNAPAKEREFRKEDALDVIIRYRQSHSHKHAPSAICSGDKAKDDGLIMGAFALMTAARRLRLSIILGVA
jgi:hypothetical protein